MHGSSYRDCVTVVGDCGACMGPTGVVVHAWVLQGLCDVHGSYRGCGACMGRTGVVVHV